MSDNAGSYFGATPPPSEAVPFAAPSTPAPPQWGNGFPPPPPVGAWNAGGYGYAPPNSGFGYGPPPKKSKNGWIIGGSIGGVVLLMVVAAIVFVVHQTNGAKQATTQYLTAIQSGDYERAYSMMCPADQAVLPESAFAAAKAAIHPVYFKIKSASVQTNNGQDEAVVYYDVNESNGAAIYATLPLVKSGGTWQICHSLAPSNGIVGIS